MTNTFRRLGQRLPSGLTTFIFNPIAIKELRGRWRSWRTMASMTIYLVGLGAICLLSYFSSTNSYSYNYYRQSPERIGTLIFMIGIGCQLVVIALNASTSSSITNEKERQNYDTLMITLLKPHDIALGKLMASVAYSMLLVFAGLPFAAIAFIIGGISVDQILAMLLLCLATAILYGLVGLFCSSIARSTKTANSFNAFLTILLIVGPPLLVYTTNNYLIPSAILRYILTCISAPLALALTAQQLYDPNISTSLFLTEISGKTVPMPWIICIIESIVISAFFFWWTTINLKPSEWSYGVVSKASKRLKKRQQ